MRVACIYFSKTIALPDFAQACVRFSPQIALREPNAVFIEIAGSKALFSEEGFRARVRVLLQKFNATATVAIADDAPQALMFARFNETTLDKLPLEALSNLADPYNTNPQYETALATMIESLHRVGMKSLAEFLKIPASQLPSRFGGLGLYCHQLLRGEVTLPWRHWTPPAQYLERRELLPSEFCADLEPLLFLSKGILERLFSRLRGRALRAEKIRVTLELDKHSAVQQPIRVWEFEFISPQSSTLSFIPILRERLNWDLGKAPLESHVIVITYEVTAYSPGKSTQKNFFHQREEFEEAMSSVFGQLEEFLGKEKVFWAQITEDRFPESSWLKTKTAHHPMVDLTEKYPLRPSRVFSRPIPITVLATTIVLKNKHYSCKRWSSVERISLDWIDQVPARNYYRIDLTGGQAFWIFSDPTHHFFLHGYFE